MTAFIITGFHRSGTSMTAEYLKRAGLSMGQDLIGPHISNIHGHFENNEIVKLHDWVLADSGSSWMYYGERQLEVTKSHREKAERLINETFSGMPQWGFKDPRACLFLDHWLDILQDCRVVMVYRHYACCLASLFKRHARELCYWQPAEPETHLNFWKDPELGLRMWLAYNKCLLAFYRKHPEKCLVVSQQSIIQGLDLSKLINNRFSAQLKEPHESTVDQRLTSDIAIDPVWIDGDLRHELEEVWHSLNTISAAGAESPELIPVGEDDSATLQWQARALVHSITGSCVSFDDSKKECRGQGPEIAPLKAEPPGAESWFQKARHELETDRSPEDALVSINRAIEMNFLRAEYHVLQGRVFMQLGSLNKAEASFCRAITQNPGVPFFYMFLALAYQRME